MYTAGNFLANISLLGEIKVGFRVVESRTSDHVALSPMDTFFLETIHQLYSGRREPDDEHSPAS